MEATVENQPALPRTRRAGDRVGDGVLRGLTALAAFLGVLVVFAIIWRVADGAWPAVKLFGVSFVWHNEWNAPLNL
jgi:phosphate transport system permease protein